MAQNQNGSNLRPKDRDQEVAPLNIHFIDCDDNDLKSTIDNDKFTVYCGPLDECYVSTNPSLEH